MVCFLVHLLTVSHLDCFPFGALMRRATTKTSRTGFCVNTCFSFIRIMLKSMSYDFIRDCRQFSRAAVPSCIGETLARVALYPSQNLDGLYFKKFFAILIGV